MASCTASTSKQRWSQRRAAKHQAVKAEEEQDDQGGTVKAEQQIKEATPSQHGPAKDTPSVWSILNAKIDDELDTTGAVQDAPETGDRELADKIENELGA